MKHFICIVMAQLDFLVGDIEGNAKKIILNAKKARAEHQADLVAFPELALSGYPPEDLLLRDGLYQRIDLALKRIREELVDIPILLGYPMKEGNVRRNAASLISEGEIQASYYKSILPNYGVFDEVRYFSPGNDPMVVDIKGCSLGVSICEDFWHVTQFRKAVAAGARMIINLNASPFDLAKHESRTQLLKTYLEEVNIPILYLNCVGGQDELIFDGGSLVGAGNKVHQAGPFFKEALIPVKIEIDPEEECQVTDVLCPSLPLMSSEERIYEALVLGVRDYVEKNHFTSTLIGLSGGIDSALTLAIAVDALGPKRVKAVMMPSRYTSDLSIKAAKEQAKILGVEIYNLSIEPIFSAYLDVLKKPFKGYPADLTEENLQARARGGILMALSNKTGALVLSTGNKSEVAVGYCTLYGDMAGGFSVLKDVPKTLVYRLVDFRNHLKHVIPESIIRRAPSAELAPDQKDSDTLPPYPVLDEILEEYIEKDRSVQDLIKMGFDREVVLKVVFMVDHNEYKRRQAPPGVRISTRSFGRDRRYPITSGYHHHLRVERKPK